MGLAWQTVRARIGSFVGSFVALAFGVALLTASALSAVSTIGTAGGRDAWLARADVVVVGADSATLPADDGPGSAVATTLESQALPADTAQRLSTVDGRVVVDHAAYGTAPDVSGDRIHPWSVADLHDFDWEGGGPPTAPDQIVVTAPTDHQVGDRITVQTAKGPRTFVVSGLLSTAAPAALYTTDDVAAELAGDRITAVAIVAGPGITASTLAEQVRAAVGGAGVRVLTGDDRVDAAPDPDYVLRAATLVVLGNSAGIAVVVAGFMVASTFAYAVAARRRELGLLRAAGATPRQLRRLVMGEAMTVAVAACAVGAVVGFAVASPFARWLADVGLAPPGYTARLIWWPVAASVGVGLVVALGAAWFSARRAGKIGPTEALREAAVDKRAMTIGRWIVGILAIGAAVPIAASFSTLDTATLTGAFMGVVLLLIIGCATLAPVLLRPLVWLLTVPVTGGAGATGTLVRNSALTAMRRTAATVAPVLVTIGIGAGILAGLQTLAQNGQHAAEGRIQAAAVVTGPISADTLAAVAGAPGVRSAVPVTERPVYVYEPSQPYDWTGRFVDGPELSQVVRMPVLSGSLADLTGTGTVAVPTGRWKLGDTLRLALPDSTVVSLRVVAVLDDQIDLNRVVLLPADLLPGHTGAPLADVVYVDFEPGAGTGPASAAAEQGGGALVPTGQFHAVLDAEGDRLNRLSSIVLLGMSLLYTAIGIANTLIMATSGRGRDVAVLRLSGATPRMVLWTIAAEALLVTVAGAVLAAVAVIPAFVVLLVALGGRTPEVLVSVPWWPIAAISAACLVIALGSSLLPAGALVRRRPGELAGIRE